MGYEVDVVIGLFGSESKISRSFHPVRPIAIPVRIEDVTNVANRLTPLTRKTALSVLAVTTSFSTNANNVDDVGCLCWLAVG